MRNFKNPVLRKRLRIHVIFGSEEKPNKLRWTLTHAQTPCKAHANIYRFNQKGTTDPRPHAQIRAPRRTVASPGTIPQCQRRGASSVASEDVRIGGCLRYLIYYHNTIALPLPLYFHCTRGTLYFMFSVCVCVVIVMAKNKAFGGMSA